MISEGILLNETIGETHQRCSQEIGAPTPFQRPDGKMALFTSSTLHFDHDHQTSPRHTWKMAKGTTLSSRQYRND